MPQLIRSLPVLIAVLVLFIGGCASADDTRAPDEPAAPSTAPSVEHPAATNQSETSVVDTGEADSSHDSEDHEPRAGADQESEDGHAESSPDDHADHDAEDGEGRAITVVMTELAFSPASFEVTAGETITFNVRNEGTIVHEFRLSNHHRIEEHIADGHQGHGESGHHGDGEGDVYVELEAGAAGTLTVTFPSDATIYTEVACLIPGHYEAGMRADLTYI